MLGKIRFNIQSRTNLIDDEMCLFLKRLGVYSVGFGFESGSEKVLSYLKRNTNTPKKNKEAILLLDKYGIGIAGSFMLGSPDETKDDIQKTLDFMEWMKSIRNVNVIWHGLTTPLPGTDLWEYAKKRKIVNDNFNWDKLDILHTRYSSKSPEPFFNGCSKKEFRALWQRADNIVDELAEIKKEQNPEAYKLYEEHESRFVAERFKKLSINQKIKKIYYRPDRAFKIFKRQILNAFKIS